jgi:hypothetical protein
MLPELEWEERQHQKSKRKSTFPTFVSTWTWIFRHPLSLLHSSLDAAAAVFPECEELEPKKTLERQHQKSKRKSTFPTFVSRWEWICRHPLSLVPSSLNADAVAFPVAFPEREEPEWEERQQKSKKRQRVRVEVRPLFRH